MATFTFETVSITDAANFSAATDTLAFSGVNGAQITVLYLAATATTPEHVTVSFGGRSVDFGTGIYGEQDTRLADGSMLYVGGPSGDSLMGTAFGDGLYGGLGGDTLNGADGQDLLQGNQGADVLDGGLGADAIYGGRDDDNITLGPAGSTDANWANGNRGADVITGAAGADTILGGQDNDALSGADGDDLLVGNLGDDVVNGDAGADTLIGEGGVDVLTGGAGSDAFLFGAGSSSAAERLVDQVLDWSALDRIHIDGAQAGYVEIAPAAPMMMGGGYGYGGYDPPPQPDTGYGAMLARANEQMAANPAVGIVAARVDLDVVVFADINGDHAADLAIVLSGATLTDISAANFF